MRHLVVDCETSGLSHEKNKVLTVGLLNADIYPDSIDIIDEQEVLVKHDEYNPSGIALKINKINLEEHHKKAIYPKFACKKINKFVKDNKLFQEPILGHNLGFDFRFLHTLYNQAKTKSFFLDNPSIDTMVLWRELRQKGVVSSELKASLKVLAKYFNVSYDGAHDALQDCKITANVYKNLLNITE